MDEWRTDPTFAMCRALVDGAELSSFAGGPFDVRAVMVDIRPEAKEGLLLGEFPGSTSLGGIVSGRPSICCTPPTRPVTPAQALCVACAPTTCEPPPCSPCRS